MQHNWIQFLSHILDRTCKELDLFSSVICSMHFPMKLFTATSSAAGGLSRTTQQRSSVMPRERTSAQYTALGGAHQHYWGVNETNTKEGKKIHHYHQFHHRAYSYELFLILHDNKYCLYQETQTQLLWRPCPGWKKTNSWFWFWLV